MAIDAIRLRNFMAFEDTKWIELRPITLLFGRNSSGKSAVFRALRLLKQSLSVPEDDNPFLFETEYGVDLGSFSDIMNYASDSEHVWFHFRCASAEMEDLLKKYNVNSNNSQNSVDNSLEFVLGYSPHQQENGKSDKSRIELADLQIRLQNSMLKSDRLLFQMGMLKADDIQLYGEDWYAAGELTHLSDAGAWAGMGCGLKGSFLPNLVKPNTETIGYQCVRELIDCFNKELTFFLRNLVYIGPIRPEPQRRYSFDRETAISWRKRDLGIFLDYIGGKLPDIKEDVNKWMQRLKLGEGADPHPVTSQESMNREYEIGIQENGARRPLPLSASGFGASQVLPIVVQCLKLNSESILLVEQPELHLHPSAQATLGDLFIETYQRDFWQNWLEACEIAMKRGSQKPPVPSHEDLVRSAPRLFIETHSEHLLLRLRRRVAESKARLNSKKKEKKCEQQYDSLTSQILPEDLRVYFVSREKELTSHIAQIGVDENGEMDLSYASPQIDDFFADDLIEISAIVDASLRSEK